MTDPITQRSLNFVANCSDPKKLQQLAANAQQQGNDIVCRAARLRLYAVLPAEAPGTLEYDVWQSIHALEDTLSNERGKTTRLSRTRQKITRDGEHKTVADLILGQQSQGFDLLVDRDMTELTFEAVALRHADRFSEGVLHAASSRLNKANLATKTN